MRGLILLSALVFFLGGCSSFTYNHKRFAKQNDAINYQYELHDNIVKKISKRTQALYDSALIVIPDKVALADKAVKKGRLATPEAVNYVATVIHNELALFEKIIRKRNLFNSVYLQKIISPEQYANKNKQKYSAIIYYEIPPTFEQGWFVLIPNLATKEKIMTTKNSTDLEQKTIEQLGNLEELLKKGSSR